MILLSHAEVERLLASERPELAVLAAWAIHDQRGRSAQRVVRAVAAQVGATEDLALRESLLRAMLSMLDKSLLDVLRELIMTKTLQFPRNPALDELLRELEAREFARAEALGEARGKALGETLAKVQALHTVLRARGLSLDAPTEARIAACEDPATLDRWIERAVTAPTLDAVFVEPGPKTRRRSRA